MWLQKVGLRGRLLLILFGIAVFLQGCMKNDTEVDIFEQDKQTIQTYLDANGIDAEMTSELGVFYKINGNGSGYKTVLGAEVEIQFQGSTLDGVEFVNTFIGSPITVILGPDNNLAGVTDGLLIGLIGLNEGDSVTIYSPSPLGFKDKAYLNVPPNSILVYNAKLIKINNLEEDLAKIDEYIADNNWTASIEPEYGIRYVVHKPGDQNVKAEYGDGISVDYQGEFLDGTIFDSSVGKDPLGFIIGNRSVIVGLEAGVTQLHDEDSATILIPSVYAYGKNGSGNIIPPNAPLLFGLDVLSVTKSGQ